MGGADPIADAAGVAQAVYPSRSRDTRPARRHARRLQGLARGDLRRPAHEPAAARARAALRRRGHAGGHAVRARRARTPPARQKAGGAQVIRVGKTAKAEGRQDHRPRGRRPRRARPGDRPASTPRRRARRAAPSSWRRRARPSTRCPPPAGRRRPAIRCCGRQGQAARRHQGGDHRPPAPAHLRARARSRRSPTAVVKQLGALGTTRRITGADPAASSVAFARFNDGHFGWNAVDPGHGLVFANDRAPRRRRGRRGAVGLRHLRPAARGHRAQQLAAPGAELPARHPARLRRRPGARRLQPRLADGRREGDLDRRPVAHRRAARDPACGARAPKIPAWPKPSSPSASGTTAKSPSTTCASSWARRPRTSRCSCATASAR